MQSPASGCLRGSGVEAGIIASQVPPVPYGHSLHLKGPDVLVPGAGRSAVATCVPVLSRHLSAGPCIAATAPCMGTAFLRLPEQSRLAGDVTVLHLMTEQTYLTGQCGAPSN